MSLYLPDIGGLSLPEAASAYARAGWFVLPTYPTNVKNPGSVVGGGWQQKSSRDPDQIREWWSEKPDYGIALHCGRSGAIVFDLDAESLDTVRAAGRDDIAHALVSAEVINGTRLDGDRGHYIFLMPPDHEYGSSAGAFMRFGEVRGKNGVIIAAPTPHPDAKTKGGIYNQRKTGVVGPLPEVLRNCLTEAGDSAEPMSSGELELFLNTHCGDCCGVSDCRNSVDGPVRWFKAQVTGGASRHEAMVKALTWGMSEASAGCYSAREAIGRLYCVFESEFTADDVTRVRCLGDEFMRMVSWAAAQADPDRAHRDDGRPSMGPVERVTRSLADVEPTKVEWLWPHWLPLGKVSILEGEPDVGKSVLTLTMAALVSNAGEWPRTVVDGVRVPTPDALSAGVVLVGVEDDEADTIVPRLVAAGADRTRIHTMRQPVDAKGNPKPFVIPDDVDRLRRAVNEVGAKLVVIDPITAYLSTRSVKAGDDPSTRQALMPLVALAAATGCAILMVRHLNKATGMTAKNRGSGTIAYTGITRAVIVAAKLKEPTCDGATHAIALTKGNLTRDPMAVGYRLDSAPSDPDVPIVTWCSPIDLTADQLVGADSAKVGDARKNAPIRDECAGVLRELLADGPMRVDDAMEKTRAVVGCSSKSVRAAADRTGVIKKAVRSAGAIDHWTWELPPTKIHPANRPGGGDEKLEPPEP